ncbi:hypothetical protein M430DRAFT_136661 [Amorphotheca resinae ATCC 22711]|uniref:F-box domain-containing protein n=1 Tax=Amorphotheca resinae ATCC 22711 TaxID=857342 RepID=A0A2T3B5C0_AMORE|nr:hypothetical protein M430DRAFT_136661 [Amorphotheca resinae ATCC 22711]PSS21933.1 hypothetical protein M430DRAFT_136661 [Amorphotheca resinae ATCC 22711]
MAILASLPHEILHAIFSGVKITDLASLRLTCHAFHELISGNRILFKDVYLQILDEPPRVKKNGEDWAWEIELQRLVKLERIIGFDTVDAKKPHVQFVRDVVGSYTETADARNSKNIALISKFFRDPRDQVAFLYQSRIWARARQAVVPITPTPPFEDGQASAQLHCLYGVPVPRHMGFIRHLPYARSIVYDLRNHSDASLWGPYRDDPVLTVDWEKMEAIMMILAHSLRLFTDRTKGRFKPVWNVPFKGVSPDSFVPISLKRYQQPAPPVDARDPYNISGTWFRVVCFLDYQELFRYNFADDDPGPGVPRPPLDTTEAVRLITMELHVTDIEEPGADDDQGMPVVSFKGKSKAMHTTFDPDATSFVRGTVRTTKKGDVRWTTFSVYVGETRWSSEGVQVGGVRSSRGVLGFWSDIRRNREGPAGPTAFWKVSNEFSEELSKDHHLHLHQHQHQHYLHHQHHHHHHNHAHHGHNETGAESNGDEHSEEQD